MDSDDQPPAAGAVAPSTSVPIAELSPELGDIGARSVHAVVTLVWPYSSSNRSLSLLLAEPDFRLRRFKGQVKVTFHGFSAQEVAHTQVGIGDEVLLCLDGVRWTDNQGPSATPGRGVAWDLHFENRVVVEISRNSQLLATVRVNRPASPPREEDTAAPATPVATDVRSELEGPVIESIQWASPAFLRSSRLSLGSLTGPAFDPFAEEDGYVPGKGRKRPRFSMRSSEWRLVDEPASPTREEATWDEMEDLDMEDDEVEKKTVQEIEGADITGETKVNGHKSQSLEYGMAATDVSATATIVEESIPTDASAGVSLEGSDKVPLKNPGAQKVHDTAEPPHPAPEVEVVPPAEGLDKRINIFRRPTDTPRLLPLPSPGLPIPSPLVTTSASRHEYFPAIGFPELVQNAQPISMDSKEDVATTEANMMHEEPARDLLQQAAERVLENAAADAIQTDVETTESVPSESAVAIGSHYPDFTPLNEIDQSIISSNVQLEGIRGKEDENEREEEVIEVEEVEDPSVLINTEAHSVDVIEQHVEEISDEDVQDEEEEDYDEDMEEYDEDVEDEEEVQEDEEGIQGGAQIPLIPMEENEGDKIEASEGDPGHTAEDVSGEEEELEEQVEEEDVRKSLPDRTYDVPEDEYDDTEGDEGHYDEESEEDYDSEQFYQEEYGESLESESESDEGPYPTRPQAPPPQRTVYPEVIVLDSDSDDEPAVAMQSRPFAQSPAERTNTWEEPETIEQEEPSVSPTAQASAPDQIHESDQDTEWSDAEEQEEEVGEAEMEDVVGAESDLEDELADSEDADRILREMPREAVGSPSVESESDLDQRGTVQSAEPIIDPELFRVEVAPEGMRPDLQREGNEEHHYQEERPFQREDTSDLSQQAHPALFLDGAGSPRVSGQVQKTRSNSFIELHDQLITPSATQQTDAVYEESEIPVAAADPMPTPQHTQETAVERVSELQAAPSYLESFTEAEPAPGEPDVPKQEDIPSPFRQRVSSSATSARFEATEYTVSVANEERRDTGVQPGMQPSIEDEVVLVEDRSLRESVETSRIETPTDPPLLPDRQATGLRSRLSYFAPLATLIDYFNSVVDTISIVVETSAPTRATSGPKDYFLTLQLTDPSMAGTIVPAQIFRPYKAVLPPVAEGDVILLRNFKIRSFNHSMMLLSTDSSAWAVFDDKGDDPRVTGPPVEYGAEERAYATSLRNWYYEAGAAMVADYRLQLSIDRGSMEETSSSSAAVSEAGSADSAWREARGDSFISSRSSRRGRKSNRRITIHELRDGTRYTEIGSPSDKESIHELRDGTVYANL